MGLRLAREKAAWGGKRRLGTQRECASNTVADCGGLAATKNANGASTPATTAGVRRPTVKILFLVLFLVLFLEILPLILTQFI